MINTATNTVTATIPLSSGTAYGLGAVAFSPNGQLAYVAENSGVYPRWR